VDASAAAKLLTEEAETAALEALLIELDDADFVSSVLLETELRCAATRSGASQQEASVVLSGIDLVEAPRSLFLEAGLLPVPGLRSLDAIHLATALRVEATLLLAYDQRLLDAAEAVGVPTLAPE
jgi:predicted nucleic acid-binding protein